MVNNDTSDEKKVARLLSAVGVESINCCISSAASQDHSNKQMLTL